VLAADDRLIVLRCTATPSRHAKKLETGAAIVILLRYGRVREMWIVSQDQAEFDAFWS
jgi:hypothetical protein